MPLADWAVAGGTCVSAAMRSAYALASRFGYDPNMPEPLQLITDSNQVDLDDLLSVVAEIVELVRPMAEAVHRIDHRTAQTDQRLANLATAYDQGGARGLRQALKGLSNGG